MNEKQNMVICQIKFNTYQQLCNGSMNNDLFCIIYHIFLPMNFNLSVTPNGAYLDKIMRWKFFLYFMEAPII